MAMRGVWAAILCMALIACDGGDDAPTADVPSGPAADEGPWALDLSRGRDLFIEKCQGCHAENGGGAYGPALNNTISCPPCETFDRLWRRIDDVMPLRNPQACDADCSRQIAAWILNGFSIQPSCRVDFRHDSIADGRYTARLRIDNFRGVPVTVWRLGLTLPPGQHVTAARGAGFTQHGEQLLLTAVAGSAPIDDGAFHEIFVDAEFGGADAPLPTALSLDASPCFAAP